MKNRFSLKFNLFDIIIIAVSLLIAVLGIVFTNKPNLREGDIVQIQYQNKVVAKIDISKLSIGQTTYTLTKEEYPDLLGDVVIFIDHEKGVCVQEVSCPDLLCKKQGFVKRAGYPIVCVPNGVIVMIVSDSDDIMVG